MPPATATDCTPLAWEIVANLSHGERGLALRSLGQRQPGGGDSFGRESKSAVRARSIITPATTRNGTAMPTAPSRRCDGCGWSQSSGSHIVLQSGQQRGPAETNRRQQAEEHADDQAQARCDRHVGSVEIDLFRNRRADAPRDDRRHAKQHECAERPAGNASNSASKKRWRISRCRLAPSAARIDSSRSRVAPRTSIMPEMFRHTMNRTVPARLRSTLLTRRVSEAPVAPKDAYGLDGRRLELVRAGIALGQPGGRRLDQRVGARDVDARFEAPMNPDPVNGPVVANTRVIAKARMPLERNEHERRRGREEMEVPPKSSGAMPTTVWGMPLIASAFPMTSGSPFIRVSQNRGSG